MIQIIREAADSKGKFNWSALTSYGLARGRSYEPLLDACRVLKSMGVDTALECGLFRAGHEEWDLRCSVGWGAKRTVSENGRTFGRWKKFPVT